MSLMGNLYIGTSGLQSSQNALNTVAHNLSNAGTAGYTRQQIAQADRRYNTISVNSGSVSNKQTGLGVYYSQTRQVRDYFLDQTYREEVGRKSFYETSYSALSQVEDLLGELNGESFNESLNSLWEAVQELAKEPSSTVKQGLLVQRASQFLERSQAVYKDLSDFQDNLNDQVKGNVDRVNTIAKRINVLNDEIIKIEVGGAEHANDLRDERNSLLDELGGLIHIDYSEDYDGAVLVKAEGHQLVGRDQTYEIGMTIDGDTGFYTPYWKIDAKVTTGTDGTAKPDISNCKVLDVTQTVSTDRDTDIGTIKAQLLARGDHRADYADLNAKTYNETISQSIIMNVQAEFDNLIHSVTTQFNKVLSDAADPANGYLVDDAGNPLQMFQKIASKGYDDSGNYVAEDLSDGKENTLYSITNLCINPDLKKEATLLNFIRPDGKEDYAAAQSLQNVFTTESYTLNPNVTNKSNLVDYYSNLVSQVANTGSVFKSVYENQTATVNSTETARQQVVGVSDDEELSSMIKFQNAYNASSRYINVVSEMLEHMISTLGA